MPLMGSGSGTAQSLTDGLLLLASNPELLAERLKAFAAAEAKAAERIAQANAAEAAAKEEQNRASDMAASAGRLNAAATELRHRIDAESANLARKEAEYAASVVAFQERSTAGDEQTRYKQQQLDQAIANHQGWFEVKAIELQENIDKAAAANATAQSAMQEAVSLRDKHKSKLERMHAIAAEG